jgi:hypothetical protein
VGSNPTLSATCPDRRSDLGQEPVDRLSRLGNARGTALCDGPQMTSSMDVADIPQVSVLHWPIDASVREHLAAFRQPRILLVEEGASPPVPLDELEDWMRSPADPSDLRMRSRVLHERALDEAAPCPIVDEQGLLRVGRSWVDLTPSQAPVVALLVDHLDRVVGYDVVGAAYERAGGSSHSASLRTLLTRIGARVRPVGLELLTVRRRGVLLTQRPRMAR